MNHQLSHSFFTTLKSNFLNWFVGTLVPLNIKRAIFLFIVHSKIKHQSRDDRDVVNTLNEVLHLAHPESVYTATALVKDLLWKSQGDRHPITCVVGGLSEDPNVQLINKYIRECPPCLVYGDWCVMFKDLDKLFKEVHMVTV